jgi:type IV secretory pathway VirB6-like protein
MDVLLYSKMNEYNNILNEIITLLNKDFVHTAYKIVEQDHNTFICNINTIYNNTYKTIFFLDDLACNIFEIFDTNPFTSLGAATATDDIMYSIYTYPRWEDENNESHTPNLLHTRIYCEIRFMAVNPEVFIRIHISIPQYNRNLNIIRDELYEKILSPKNCHNFIDSSTLKLFNS